MINFPNFCLQGWSLMPFKVSWSMSHKLIICFTSFVPSTSTKAHRKSNSVFYSIKITFFNYLCFVKTLFGWKYFKFIDCYFSLLANWTSQFKITNSRNLEAKSESCNSKEVSIAYGKNPDTGELTCYCTCDGSDPGKGFGQEQNLKFLL